MQLAKTLVEKCGSLNDGDADPTPQPLPLNLWILGKFYSNLKKMFF
jgi:hypothetical protein